MNLIESITVLWIFLAGFVAGIIVGQLNGIRFTYEKVKDWLKE